MLTSTNTDGCALIHGFFPCIKVHVLDNTKLEFLTIQSKVYLGNLFDKNDIPQALTAKAAINYFAETPDKPPKLFQLCIIEEKIINIMPSSNLPDNMSQEELYHMKAIHVCAYPYLVTIITHSKLTMIRCILYQSRLYQIHHYHALQSPTLYKVGVIHFGGISRGVTFLWQAHDARSKAGRNVTKMCRGWVCPSRFQAKMWL